MSITRLFNVDFGKKQGKIKPLHAINGGPLSGGAQLPYDMSAEYREIKPPIVRCVMPDGSCGYNQFICVHSVFPDFSLDENDAESYNFAPTDKYLQSIRESGAQIFYTLGESAEYEGKRLYTIAPSDYEKWARVCEHIIMHYNEGFADGFKWNIKHFEIWNGADQDECFLGERTEFFELYRVVSNYLKERFPRIKIGAFGAIGFSSQNRIDARESERKSFDFTTEFLTFVCKNDTKSPLDFFTWRCFARTPEELSLHAKYARSYLDLAGLKRTKSIVSQFNLYCDGAVPPSLLEEYPAFLAASLILAQKSAIDTMFYSTGEVHDFMNALYTVDDCVTHRRYAAFEVMEGFSALYSLGNAVETSEDYPREVNLLAAKGAEEGAIMLSSRSFDGRVEIALSGSDYSTCSVKRIAPGTERGEGRVSCIENLKIAGNKLVISVRKNETYFITLK